MAENVRKRQHQTLPTENILIKSDENGEIDLHFYLSSNASNSQSKKRKINRKINTRKDSIDDGEKSFVVTLDDVDLCADEATTSSTIQAQIEAKNIAEKRKTFSPPPPQPLREFCHKCGAGFPTGYKLTRHLTKNPICNHFMKNLRLREKYLQKLHRLAEKEKPDDEVSDIKAAVSVALDSDDSGSCEDDDFNLDDNRMKDTDCDPIDPDIDKIIGLTCQTCDLPISSLVEYRKHVRENHGNYTMKPYSCALCKKRFGFRQNVRNHIHRNHYDKTYFTCDVCGLAFKWRNDLTTHRKKEHDEI